MMELTVLYMKTFDNGPKISMVKSTIHTVQKMKLCIKGFFTKFPPDLIAFTKEIHNGKLHFLYNVTKI